ncbi:MAG: bifunctional methylenetetrahydrofolate dehydrogenase/methenyltetrahydrofolate cyclohydrolase FolD [Bacteroidetes bacterium]|nr:bifunctional methylenetetrahydrofolate dehydrogenase/methenyltetrahydrofolate cyclohydrolase FolD [Rhodothermia bacterium]MCS7154654.1 bifunctional methylenetetrahydrofolate dehydrogenase/methenyltetrahydrofolate cyclohydrolase FolD [Bacteroidota bacterium]MCX7906371.1 bifunctional methylenetetrahydrofolate dehydrogenase/methenyltetrahydrofolate cyclohydrolase FolD [Bacteroidota bacterium]MDW8137447.1 bifunctional methylenetetrahydrofolate dehydrogenase/methenyltetrahydrofolate cyclohydrolase
MATYHLLDGKHVAAIILERLRQEVANWVQAGHRRPFLAVLLVGEHPASASYVRAKRRAAAEVGIDSETIHLPSTLSEAELLERISRLNTDPSVDGILVQLPLPPHISTDRVIAALDPSKDVDGFHPLNAGRLMLGQPGFRPCTPAGIWELLRAYEIPLSGRRVVVLGRSHIVGLPLANLLLQKGIDATVTVCHSRTRDLAALTRQAEILVAAIGQPRFVNAEMVAPGAVVVDVGINRLEDPTHPRGYRLVGDVDFESVASQSSWITPVPGGVGPMTIAMLLENTLRAAQRLYYPEPQPV